MAHELDCRGSDLSDFAHCDLAEMTSGIAASTSGASSGSQAGDRAPASGLGHRPAYDFRRLVEEDVLPLLQRRPLATVDSVGLFLPGGALSAVPPMPSLADCVIVGCDRLLAHDICSVERLVEDIRSAGCSGERILLALFAPMASELRRLWNEDLCNYADMVLAFCDLQGILRRFARQGNDGTIVEKDSRVMLTTADRDEDAGAGPFGLVLLSELFRMHGWQSWVEPDCFALAFSSALSAQWFDVVEMVVGSKTSLDGVASGIRSIRRSSANRHVGVVLCGSRFADEPEEARLLGADLIALEPISSLKQATAITSRPQQLPL